MIVICALVAAPIQAFTSKVLDIEVLENGDAIISFNYEITWYESLALSARMVDLNKDVGDAIKSNFGNNAEIIEMTTSNAKIRVPNYVIVRPYTDGTTEYETPSLSFKNAQESLNKYWFTKYLTVDFSPEEIRIKFPDGYEQKFHEQISIPAVSNKQGIR
jgi:hypothetical protein